MNRAIDEGASAQSFLVRVGVRVRSARAARGISRNILAERSEVSLRYLAQLEAGEGNISIALLHRVAGALALRVDELVGDGAHPELEALWRAASPAQRERALDILDP